MTLGPIEKPLRECADDGATAPARAGKLLRSLPEPLPLSDSARRRTLRAFAASSRGARGLHLTALQWAVFAVLLVSTAAAGAKRIWFPSWPHRYRAVVTTVVESAEETVVRTPSAATEKRSNPTQVVEEPSPPKVARSAAKARASTPPKPEPVRPRLLSDPQLDAVARVLPQPVYQSDMYSILLDVCVSAQGQVSRVSVVRGQDAALDRRIVEAVQRWTYQPGEADGQPAPMCFPLVYRIQIERD